MKNIRKKIKGIVKELTEKDRENRIALETALSQIRLIGEDFDIAQSKILC